MIGGWAGTGMARPTTHSRNTVLVIVPALWILQAANVQYPPPKAPAATAPPGTQMSPQQLDDLVPPIALCPDPLVAQVLAASTYPIESKGCQGCDADHEAENTSANSDPDGSAVQRQSIRWHGKRDANRTHPLCGGFFAILGQSVRLRTIDRRPLSSDTRGTAHR